MHGRWTQSGRKEPSTSGPGGSCRGFEDLVCEGSLPVGVANTFAAAKTIPSAAFRAVREPRYESENDAREQKNLHKDR
jgi:hypothetical protein